MMIAFEPIMATEKRAMPLTGIHGFDAVMPDQYEWLGGNVAAVISSPSQWSVRTRLKRDKSSSQSKVILTRWIRGMVYILLMIVNSSHCMRYTIIVTYLIHCLTSFNHFNQ